MASILGCVEVERTRSVIASMARKRYMGSFKVGVSSDYMKEGDLVD